MTIQVETPESLFLATSFDQILEDIDRSPHLFQPQVPFRLENEHLPQVAGNIAHCMSLGHSFVEQDTHIGQRGVIVGKGPGLTAPGVIEGLKFEASQGAKFIAVKEAADWLIDHGLPCHYAFNCDQAPHQPKRMRATGDRGYLLATNCHPDLFRHLAGCRIQVFHSATGAPGELEAFAKWHGPVSYQGFNATTRAVPIAVRMGFKVPILMAGCDYGWKVGQTLYADGMINGGILDGQYMMIGSAYEGRTWITKQDLFYSAIGTAKLVMRGWVEMAGPSLATDILDEPGMAGEYWDLVA